jgi:SAM-dependent methyltransferase
MAEELAQLRGRLQSLKKECQEIGRIPLRPPGLRAALGGIAVSVMHRLMFWYAPALQSTIGGLIQTVEDALAAVDRTARQESEQRTAALENRLRQERIEATAATENRLREEISRTAAAMESRLQQERIYTAAALESRLREERSYTNMLEARLNEQVRAVEQERATTIGLESAVREQADSSQQFEEEQRQKEEELGRRLAAADDRLQLLRREVLENAQRLVRLLDEARQQAKGTAAPPLAFAQEDAGALDPLYAALESEIRGTRGEVQERWKLYLPLMPRDAPVLDLGCGRGEWLELLRQEGIAARGVDGNRLMVAECRERQLEAEQAEALDYLARTPDGSLGAVTVLRMIERLPFRDLVRLLDEVARILRPGGTAVFETPNPDNLLVASRDFYTDPGRRHPIPSETLRFLVESRGLAPVEVLFLNSCDPSAQVPEEDGSAVARRFNRYFYGPRDYAVVGRKV